MYALKRFLGHNGRQLSILVAITGTAFLALTLWYLQDASPGLPLTITKQAAKATTISALQVVEMEGLALGKPFEIPINVTSEEARFREIVTVLRTRVAETADKAAAYPTCSLNLERYHITRPPKRDNIVSIAINLHDSEAIIPAQALALVEAVFHLLKQNKVYISIFENGSADKTKTLLSDLAAALQAIGVQGLWVHSSHMKSDFTFTDRIVVLSEIRNLALVPLLPYATNSGGEGTLLFVNDVVTCASDVLELVHQQRLQQADMVVGIDWGTITYDNKTTGQERPGTRLYDMWVLRGINGDLPYPFAHSSGYSPESPSDDWVQDAFYSQDFSIRRRWLDGRPLPIYSGWGGMAAFDASLFSQHHLRFRSSTASGWDGGSAAGAMGDWGSLLATKGYMESDCSGASECKYIARDIWNLRHGLGRQARVVLAPQARTTYEVEAWEVMRHLAPPARRDGADADGADLIDWAEVVPPETVVCIPSRGKEGDYMDVWDERNKRRRLAPLVDWNATSPII